MQAPGRNPFDAVDLKTSPPNGHKTHPCPDGSPTEPQNLQVSANLLFLKLMLIFGLL